jgi:hypothetical protein
MGVLKRQRELRKQEKAAFKREKKARRQEERAEDAGAGHQVATREDLEGYGLGPELDD